MKDTEKTRVFSSPPFVFLVGPDQKKYTIHSNLVAQQSKALRTLVYGSMKEALDGCAKWDETDEDTFLRFSQYVYSGRYDEPEPKKRPETDTAQSPDAAPNSQPENEPWPEPPPKRTPVRRRKPEPVTDDMPTMTKKSQLWAAFSRLFRVPSAIPQQRGNGPDDDCSGIFLCHARLYVLADYHGIDTLQRLALFNLRRSLERFQLHEEGCRDIEKLLEFSFGETVDKGERADPLRSLVCHYVACKIEELWQDESFQILIGELPDFPTSLLSVLLNRLD